MHTLELRRLNSGYDKQTGLHDIGLTIQEPAIYVVLRPNGAGKTTLFRTIAITSTNFRPGFSAGRRVHALSPEREGGFIF